MFLPDKTTILIVGAGPTGLAAALSLLHHGIRDFIIVDALPRGNNLSRAVSIHAAALEALYTVGCGDDVASQGIKATALESGTRSRKLGSLRTESLKAHTPYPYILVITQNVVERIIEKKLTGSGVAIHWSTKVVGLARNPMNSRLSDVMFEDGRVITATYVIGADGARSSVRTLVGIGFSDPTIVEGGAADAENNLAQAVLADVSFSNIDEDDITPKTTFSPYSFFLFFPLPSSYNESLAADGQPTASDRLYRIYCGVPISEGEIPHAPSKEYVQNLINRFGPYSLSSDPTVNPNPKPTWVKQVFLSSRFRTHVSIADTTLVRLDGDGGVVLLVGDAAHVHSPAGGLGMSLGLRDAIFLGETLAEHIRATETKSLSDADAILQEFAATRRARALEAIKLSNMILSIEGMKYRERMAWWFPVDSETFRTWFFWIVGNVSFIQSFMVWQLSGLGGR